MAADAFAIEEDFEVLGSDNRHVGEVDELTIDGLKLNRRDSEAGGRHHLLPIDMIDRVVADERKVFLNCTQAEAERRWRALD
jgi:hypothetical protein